ncbi:AAA family ATPase [Nakamurella sp.]|uniref:helix-turn-helix transcriptional regulator n=1 Tax=Nakamurella sp. TaxID=1869182 RepID=UPI003784C8DE
MDDVAATVDLPFVGRVDQLSLFRTALGRARTGEPSAILVSGDAGVGKTRLLARMAELADADGAWVVICHCVDLGDVGLPYLPFTEALGQLHGRSDRVDAAIAGRPALARLLDAGLVEPETGAAGQAARGQLFDGIASAIGAGGGADRPLVLMIEDLHWADPSSRDVLKFLVARMRAEHLLLVASYRTDDLHRRHPLRPVLSELLRHPRVDHIDLAPFSRDELAQFGAAITGRPVPEPNLMQVLRRSEGNAYFAQELLESQDGGGLGLPGSLADVLHARLERLDPAVQALAGIASVAGRRVSGDLLSAVARDEPDFPDDAAVDHTLREAIAHHVLAIEDARWIVFRHALLAEAVYGDLLPSEVSRLHRAYQRRIAADPSLGSPAELAHHAQRAHDLPAALAAGYTAAQEAADMLAPMEALRHLETVISLWEAVPDAADRIGRDLIDVQMTAALAASRAGQPARAAGLAVAALDRSDPARAARLTPAAASYLIDDQREREAVRRAEQALAVLDADGPSADRARLLAAYARSALNCDRDDEARVIAERAVAEAQQFDVPEAASDALTTLGVLAVNEADLAGDLFGRSLALSRAAGDLTAELRATHNLAANRYYAGDLTRAARICADGIDRARSVGVLWMGYGVGLLLYRELIRFVSGDLTPPPPSRDWVPGAAGTVLATIDLYAAVARGDEDAVHRGRVDEVEWQRDPMLALVSGGCTIDALTWAGDHQAAIDLTVRLTDFMSQAWNDYFLGGIWLSALGLAAAADRAEVSRLAGGATADLSADLGVGRAFLDRMERTAARGRPRGGRLGPEGRGWVARARAEFGRLTGQNEPELWRDAVAEFGYGYRYEVARSRWRLAEALAGRGDRPAAAAEAAAALTDAQAIGARPLVAAVRELGRRARLDLPGTEPASGVVLTGRETEVLRLVADGLTNRQIGERLFISGKTVSVHISNVLAKLGAGGRAEAVAVAHRQGLLADGE